LNIRFTSSLTPEDENMLAPALLKALSSILDVLPIAYAIRIDTSDAQVYQHGSRQPGGVAVQEVQRPRPAGVPNVAGAEYC
jgi:hypothetical protein